MHPVINFSHVTKEYPLYHHIGSGIKDLIFHPKRAFQLLKGRKYLAIEDVSFTVGKGEAVALIGRNGAGKSTSLGLVAGVIKPTKGTVTTEGRVASMLELGGGFHPELTGRENIYLNATLLGLRRKEVQQRMERIIEFSELGDIAFQAKCIQTIRDFKKRGVTILFVSHNMSDVEKICDRVIWIENHRLREVGSADRIIELYKQAMA